MSSHVYAIQDLEGERGGMGGGVLWRNRRGSFSSGMYCCSIFIHSNIYFIVLSKIFATRISFCDIFEEILWINELLSKFKFYNQFHHTFVIEIYRHTNTCLGTEYTECQAFCPVVINGSPSPASEYVPPTRVLGGPHSLARRGWGDPIPTKGQTFWYSMYSIL